MAAKNTGKDYEKLAQNIFQQIINQDTFKNIEVQQDVTLHGKTGKHQIDVYWEFSLQGIFYRTIIQAKDWKSKVPQKEILAFKEILDDLPVGTNGVYVCKSGYQSGARQIAEAHGIKTYELRKPVDSDFEGQIARIYFSGKYKIPHYENLSFVIDKGWVEEAHLTDKIDMMIGQGISLDSGTPLYDSIGGKVIGCIRDALYGLVENSSEEPQEKTYAFQTPTYIEIKPGLFVRMKEIAGTVYHRTYEDKFQVGYEDIIGYILKDISSGSFIRFDKSGNLLDIK